MTFDSLLNPLDLNHFIFWLFSTVTASQPVLIWLRIKTVRGQVCVIYP